jgi:hypothetical protein
MHTNSVIVTSVEQLYQALKNNDVHILIQGELDELSTFKLSSGGVIKGSNGAKLKFRSGQPGISLCANTRLESICIETDIPITAVTLADEEEDLGEIHIHDVTTVGRFHLEAASALKAHIHLSNIHVEQADARMAAHRPMGFGVEVLLGAITIYNFSKNPESQWTLKAENLSCGSKDMPVRGSGIYLFGGNYIPINADLSSAPAPIAAGGQLQVELLSTGPVYSDGGISAGVANMITGGIFLGSGAHAKKILNKAKVVTYGINDMVLDNWGTCEQWLAQADIVSYNTSGIGFVNFGIMHNLQILGAIETHGVGARGFNLYDGELNSATFKSITTHGNGAIGIQLSKPFGQITVLKDIRTTGGEGESLVRGKIVILKAHALSLKPGVKGESLIIVGKALTENPSIPTYEFTAPASSIAKLEVTGKVIEE